MQLKNSDIHSLAKGTAFLGSGGGGQTGYIKKIVENQIAQNRPASFLEIWQLEDSDLLLGITYVGSPLVWTEILPSLVVIENLLGAVENYNKKLPAALFPLSVGGGNGLFPVCFTSQKNIPILDGDFLGRTFPKLTMISTNLFEIPIQCAWLSDAFGNIHQIEPKSYEDLEGQARDFCIKSGLVALLGCAFRKKDIEKALIQGTVSKALRLGQCATIEELCAESQGRVLINGFIKECRYETVDGLLNGTIAVEAVGGSQVEILLRNEFVQAKDNKEILAQCPDIISLINVETGEVIPGENIAIGQWVYVVAAKGPEIWYTPKGRALIGEIQ